MANLTVGSQEFNEVIARGCGEYCIGDEVDCFHDYEWTCDHCPIVIQNQLDKSLKEDSNG